MKTKILTILLLCILLVGTLPLTAFASTTTYSDVLDDLQLDSTFDTSYYPTVSTDYSLSVIQLAESTDSELFVYVYQPSGQVGGLVASSINISTTINDYISYYNYKLELVSSSGTLYKYKVPNLIVKSDTTRYYVITSIYRPFDESIDTQADYDNTITEVNYDISRQYCFSTINGMEYVSVVDIETITVTDKFVGFVRYSNGFALYSSSCDSHFVAFNTDRDIDSLLEADVYYTTQDYSSSFATFVGENETFGTVTDNYAYLSYTDKVEHTGNGLFAGTYTWDRIETVEQFVSENTLTQDVYTGAVLDASVASTLSDTAIEALEGMEWVLRFCETEYSSTYSSMSSATFSTIVGNVTILRLKFETDGIVYNLGVIDNKQTGSDDPVNGESYSLSINTDNNLWWILALVLLAIFIVLMICVKDVLDFVIGIIRGIFKVVYNILYGIWWLVSSVFVCIYEILKTIFYRVPAWFIGLFRRDK